VGNNPNYQVLIPQAKPIEETYVSFNPLLLYRIAKALVLNKNKGVTLAINKDPLKPIRIVMKDEGDNTTQAVLMPMRR